MDILEVLRSKKNFRSVYSSTDGIEFLVDPIGLNEVWNDHNGELFNLYEVIQNRSTFLDFKQLCCNTLYCEDQFTTSVGRHKLPIEYFGPPSVPRAWDYFVALNFSLDANMDVFKDNDQKIINNINSNCNNWMESIGNLDKVHRRLQLVELRRMGAEDFIKHQQASSNSDILLFLNTPKNTNIKNLLELCEQTGLGYVLLTDERNIVTKERQFTADITLKSRIYHKPETLTKTVIKNF